MIIWLVIEAEVELATFSRQKTAFPSGHTAINLGVETN